MTAVIPAVFQTISSGGEAIKAFSSLRAQAVGDQRALIGEMKDNLHYLDMVIRDSVALGDVISHVSTAEYKRLSKSGYDFNKLNKKKIGNFPSLAGTDLAVWQGKVTAQLVEAIYEKLQELKIKYPFVSSHSRYRWNVRVHNIRKRIWLLLVHLRNTR